MPEMVDLRYNIGENIRRRNRRIRSKNVAFSSNCWNVIGNWWKSSEVRPNVKKMKSDKIVACVKHLGV
jgi:hypothetical protein